ncbi:hypothetical protein T02_5923 [Trichinella nativa]|uniref:Tetraspanin family protein n=1 Tax=Trichinella nativa TaxID=6335 RepID=A0A0V1KW32_9BILA|nr:hypothetical protein T06_6308 [Trichinella sp. T6]KRZ51164.1 hypothetical protein T02_5923 [Trichinella nativa]
MVTVFIEEAEDNFCCVEEDDSEKPEKTFHLMLIRIVLIVFFMVLFTISVAIFTVGFLHMSKDSELFIQRRMSSWEFYGLGIPYFHSRILFLTGDYIQQSNKCCGLKKSLNKSQIIYQSYYTTLFWLESTNWGQMQQMEIQYNDLYYVPYVPLSCCINQSVINCNWALFGDRSDNFTTQMQQVPME